MRTSDKVFGIICGVDVLGGVPCLIGDLTVNFMIARTVCIAVSLLGLVIWSLVCKKWK